MTRLRSGRPFAAPYLVLLPNSWENGTLTGTVNSLLVLTIRLGLDTGSSGRLFGKGLSKMIIVPSKLFSRLVIFVWKALFRQSDTALSKLSFMFSPRITIG